jgi:hypothetical protein
MIPTTLDKVLHFQCLAVVVAVVMLSLGSNAPAAAAGHCRPGFIDCDAYCMPTVNDCCFYGGGESCRDACWISDVGPICCPRWQYGTADGRCVNYGFSLKPARLPGEKEGLRSETPTASTPPTPTASTPPEKGVPQEPPQN